MKMPKLSGLGAIGLAVAMIAALTLPASAMAQGDKAAAKLAEAAQKAGMAEAPPVLAATGLPCQMSTARKIGEDKKNKKSYYEVACAPGSMGYVLETNDGVAPTAYSCIEANTSPAPGQPPSAPCLLPANANPAALLIPLMKTAGVDCTPTEARGIGQTKANTYMEVACQSGAGYILVASVPFDGAKPMQAQNCLIYDDADTNIKCKIGDRASRLAVVDRYVTGANNGCAVKDKRFVGLSKDGSAYYEASCNDGKGYIYKADSAGTLKETYDCAKATQILGGCSLTDARQAQTEQAGLYTKLAQKLGSKCDVERYALFPPKSGEEDVELVCKDGSGAIGIFKVGGAGSQLLDCGRAPVAGFKCSLGKDTGFANLTADLKKFKSDTTCDVTASRLAGKTEKGTTYVEVACADKLKGYMIEYQPTPAVRAIAVTNCSFAGNCKLPGNT